MKKPANTKRIFRNICKENNLRYKLDESGNPISPTRKRKFDDHLYWDGHVDKIGVYVERETNTKYNHIKKKLLSVGCEVNQDGDNEGTFYIAKENVLVVAKLLGTTKNEISEEKRAAARERMKKLWASGAMKK